MNVTMVCNGPVSKIRKSGLHKIHQMEDAISMQAHVNLELK